MTDIRNAIYILKKMLPRYTNIFTKKAIKIVDLVIQDNYIYIYTTEDVIEDVFNATITGVVIDNSTNPFNDEFYNNNIDFIYTETPKIYRSIEKIAINGNFKLNIDQVKNAYLHTELKIYHSANLTEIKKMEVTESPQIFIYNESMSAGRAVSNYSDTFANSYTAHGFRQSFNNQGSILLMMNCTEDLDFSRSQELNEYFSYWINWCFIGNNPLSDQKELSSQSTAIQILNWNLTLVNNAVIIYKYTYTSTTHISGEDLKQKPKTITMTDLNKGFNFRIK